MTPAKAGPCRCRHSSTVGDVRVRSRAGCQASASARRDHWARLFITFHYNDGLTDSLAHLLKMSLQDTSQSCSIPPGLATDGSGGRFYREQVGSVFGADIC